MNRVTAGASSSNGIFGSGARSMENWRTPVLRGAPSRTVTPRRRLSSRAVRSTARRDVRQAGDGIDAGVAVDQRVVDVCRHVAGGGARDLVGTGRLDVDGVVDGLRDRVRVRTLRPRRRDRGSRRRRDRGAQRDPCDASTTHLSPRRRQHAVGCGEHEPHGLRAVRAGLLSWCSAGRARQEGPAPRLSRFPTLLAHARSPEAAPCRPLARQTAPNSSI